MQWTAFNNESGLIDSLMVYRKDEPASIGTVISEVPENPDSPSYLTIHLPDGTIRSGPLADFEAASEEQFRQFQETMSRS